MARDQATWAPMCASVVREERHVLSMLVQVASIPFLVLLCSFGAAQGNSFRCFDPPPGNVSRSHIEIKLAEAPWLNHALVSSVTELVLTEFLGYSVTR
eukprot:4051842-Amphidinium_carterae.1